MRCVRRVLGRAVPELSGYKRWSVPVSPGVCTRAGLCARSTGAPMQSEHNLNRSTQRRWNTGGKPPGSAKLARAFVMEINRVRSDYGRDPTPAKKEAALRAITATSLRSVEGVDARVVAHTLATLVVLSASPDIQMVVDCASWLQMHGMSLNGGNGSDVDPAQRAVVASTITKALCSLNELRYADLYATVSVYTPLFASVVDSVAPSTLCMLLDIIVASKVEDRALLRSVASHVLRNMGQLGATERVMVARALGRAELQHHGVASTSSTEPEPARQPGTSGSAEDPDGNLKQVAEAAWSSITESDLVAVSFTDIVQLLGSVAGAPPSVRANLSAKIENEFLKRVSNPPASTSDAPPAASEESAAASIHQKVTLHECLIIADAVKHVNADLSPKAVEMSINLLRSNASENVHQLTPDTAAKIYGVLATHDPSSVPDDLTQYLVRSINERKQAWTPEAVSTMLHYFHNVPERKADSSTLAGVQLEIVRRKAVSGVPIDSRELAAVFTAEIVSANAEGLASAINVNIPHWSFTQTLHLLESALRVQTESARAVMRDIAASLVPHTKHAAIHQLAAMMQCYGTARVRNDALCEAVSQRAASLRDAARISHVSSILGALASVEYRSTALFTDYAPLVIAQAAHTSAKDVARLLAAYAKMLIWDFQVMWQLAQRATEVCDAFNNTELVAVLCALNRMDLKHPALTEAIHKRVRPGTGDVNVQAISMFEAVALLSALTRAGVRDVELFNTISERAELEKETMSANEIAELLISFVAANHLEHKPFDALLLRCVAIVPTCSPLAMSHIITAYAAAGVRHDELFSIIADRVISSKEDIPAITIASVLAAFATANVKNDRLFIEVIPRVRHVAHYGTARDVYNVVSAYAAVGLWHYKLFARLGERLIQLRGECRCAELAGIFKAYASVGMRYDKLFTEMSPRVQTMAHLLSLAEVVDTTKAYSDVNMNDKGVFSSCGDRALALVSELTREDASSLVESYATVSFAHPDLFRAIQTRFPDMKIPSEVFQAARDGQGEEGERNTGEHATA